MCSLSIHLVSFIYRHEYTEKCGVCLFTCSNSLSSISGVEIIFSIFCAKMNIHSSQFCVDFTGFVTKPILFYSVLHATLVYMEMSPPDALLGTESLQVKIISEKENKLCLFWKTIRAKSFFLISSSRRGFQLLSGHCNSQMVVIGLKFVYAGILFALLLIKA